MLRNKSTVNNLGKQKYFPIPKGFYTG